MNGLNVIKQNEVKGTSNILKVFNTDTSIINYQIDMIIPIWTTENESCNAMITQKYSTVLQK